MRAVRAVRAVRVARALRALRALVWQQVLLLEQWWGGDSRCCCCLLLAEAASRSECVWLACMYTLLHPSTRNVVGKGARGKQCNPFDFSNNLLSHFWTGLGPCGVSRGKSYWVGRSLPPSLPHSISVGNRRESM